MVLRRIKPILSTLSAALATLSWVTPAAAHMPTMHMRCWTAPPSNSSMKVFWTIKIDEANRVITYKNSLVKTKLASQATFSEDEVSWNNGAARIIRDTLEMYEEIPFSDIIVPRVGKCQRMRR